MKGKALCPPFLQTMTHTHSLKLCDASRDMGHSISPGFVAKKNMCPVKDQNLVLPELRQFS